MEASFLFRSRGIPSQQVKRIQTRLKGQSLSPVRSHVQFLPSSVYLVRICSALGSYAVMGCVVVAKDSLGCHAGNEVLNSAEVRTDHIYSKFKMYGKAAAPFQWGRTCTSSTTFAFGQIPLHPLLIYCEILGHPKDLNTFYILRLPSVRCVTKSVDWPPGPILLI